MIWVGAQYVVVSPDNESVITSVVSVTFIVTIDELILMSLVATRLRRGLEHTEPVSFDPTQVASRFYVRCRTAWRMFVDPLIILLISFCCFHSAMVGGGCPYWVT